MDDRVGAIRGSEAEADAMPGGGSDDEAATDRDPGRRAVLNRVRRAQGQLGGVLRMLEEGRDPQAVLHQMKAVSSALDRAGFALVAHEWRERAAVNGGVSEDQLADLEKLVLSLS